MLKNMKIGKRISLMISLVLIVGLLLITLVTITSVRKTTENDTKNRFGELVDARATVVDEYFYNHTDYLAQFAAQGIVKDTLKNPTPENIAYLKEQVVAYRQARAAMEGMFVADKDLICLIHSDVPAAENVLVTKTPAEDILNNSKTQANGTWLKGLAQSTATGQLVAPAYCPVYDDNGSLLGYVGGGCYIDELQDLVYGMDLNGYNNAQINVVNANAGNYIFSPDESQIGQEYDENVAAVVAEAVANGSGIIEFSAGDTMMLAYQYLPNWGFVIFMTDSEAEIYSGVNSLTLQIIGVCLATLIGIILVTILVTNSIAKDIRKVSDIITGIGTLDITNANRLSEFNGRKDEIGDIADATGKLSYAVTDAVKTIQEKAAQLEESAEKLRENAEHTSEALEQVDTAVQEIATGATSQSQETQEATENVIQIGGMIEETSVEADHLKQASRQMQESSTRVKEILEKLGDANRRTYESVGIIAEKTNETNKSAESIKDAAGLISEIASQTNLLSLNASIEAARAGEAGRGFAVVAEEIGKLAEQSSESAQQIGVIISDLVANSTNAVATMEEVKSTIEEQSRYVEDTRNIFGEVDTQIDQSLAGMDNISDKIKNMDRTRTAVVDTVQNLTAIAEENAASTEETSASATMVGNMMENVSGIAEEIAGLSDNIKESVSVFKI